MMKTPPQGLSLNTLAFGVNRTGTNRAPGRPVRFSSAASLPSSMYGAPTTSNGVSVPRPTDTADSNNPTPGYRMASVRFLIFGEGLVQGQSVWSNQNSRVQPSTGTTVRSA